MAITHDHVTVPQFSEYFDPTDTPNFTMDWTDMIGSADVSSSNWATTPTLTVVSDYVNGKTTTVVLSGLTVDNTYTITNTIVTNDSPDQLTWERSFQFSTKEL